MADIRLLERTLQRNVAWNRARINFVAKFLVALIQVRSVNLAEVASVFAGGALKESHYKRIQRFLRHFELPYAGVAAFVLKLLGVPRPWALTLDRTDWYLGQTPLNILVLGVCHHGTAWFRYLRRTGIACRIRIRANTKVTNGRGLPVAARRLFRHCRVGHGEALRGARVIWGERWHVTGMRLPKGEYVIVVSERETRTALEDYARRWEVETLFGCLKTRGFCLEATHVTEPERLKKLLALVALAFCWAHVVGEWLSAQKSLPIKKHGRKAVSIFRHGLDHLRRILCNQLCEAERVALRRVIKLLSCT